MNRGRYATQGMGEASVGPYKLIFTLTTDLNINSGSGGNGTMGSYNDAIASGANPTSISLLDGNTSVALAYLESSNGVLKTQFKGLKHTHTPFYYYINTYFMFICGQ